MITSSASGRSLAGMWMMVNALQILRYLSLNHLFLSKPIFSFMADLSFVGLQNEILEDMFLVHVNEDQLSHKAVDNYRFESQGIESESILLINSDVFMFQILFLVYTWVMFVLSKFIKPYNPVSNKVMDSGMVKIPKLDKRRDNGESELTIFIFSCSSYWKKS